MITHILEPMHLSTKANGKYEGAAEIEAIGLPCTRGCRKTGAP
eukprot:CAMPEP_0170640346 /NCGR_PEP_ID=MMETSP0224-20130122/40173_1 /TAXON_ID=285029 /ORGANISM="Togula jolla, Strain CCCM 725" /LENGTH=42 /DNA_ID= /DNA_START= /DNA_END= /DNA_ORIENTATION=